MASSIAALAAILFASFALAVPQPIIQRDTIPTSAEVTWCQAPLNFDGLASIDGSCGFSVSQGQLNTTQCYVLHTDALGIKQDSTHECVFKMWEGVSDCSGDGSWTSYSVPSGQGTTCIETGILDGGEFIHKSGVLSCS